MFLKSVGTLAGEGAELVGALKSLHIILKQTKTETSTAGLRMEDKGLSREDGARLGAVR